MDLFRDFNHHGTVDRVWPFFSTIFWHYSKTQPEGTKLVLGGWTVYEQNKKNVEIIEPDSAHLFLLSVAFSTFWFKLDETWNIYIYIYLPKQPLWHKVPFLITLQHIECRVPLTFSGLQMKKSIWHVSQT